MLYASDNLFITYESKEIKMKRTERLLIVVIVVMAVTLVVGFLPIHGEEKIYDVAVRLHVIANSDSEEDQRVKLLVRDEILKIVEPKVSGCTDQAEAICSIGSVMDEIKAAAEDVIRNEGYSYCVTVEIEREKYPTRDYGDLVFPSGEYVSLRVNIGDAEGRNFWCCLYPPLCMSAASQVSKDVSDDAFIQAGLTGEQYKIITENDDIKYRVRFKILEVAQKIWS